MGQMPSDPAVASFALVGESITQCFSLGTFGQSQSRRYDDCCRKSGLMSITNPEQRQHLMHQIESFVKMSADEQGFALTDTLPSLEEYRLRRMGTSAVGVCLIMTE